MKHSMSGITKVKIKRFLELMVLMGQLQKANIKDYWMTDPTTAINYKKEQYGKLSTSVITTKKAANCI
jgi:hypothetical protein